MSKLALLAALAAIIIATVNANTNHHRERRSPGGPVPLYPKLAAAIPLLAYKSGGSGASPLPPHVDPNIGQSTAQLNSMVTGASMSGPLAVLGTLNILASFVMAIYYFQSVNAARRAGYANGGPYIQKRSSQNFHQKSIASFINSFRWTPKCLEFDVWGNVTVEIKLSFSVSLGAGQRRCSLHTYRYLKKCTFLILRIKSKAPRRGIKTFQGADSEGFSSID